MGYIRFLLAAIVLVSHSGGGIPAMSAESAVEAFFVISGYYMALTFETHYLGAGGIWKFYLSRYIRLYPLYFMGLITMLAIAETASALHWDIDSIRSFAYFTRPQDGVQHIAVWSLFFQDILSIDPARAWALPLPQAWSISAELIFYLLTPALLMIKNRLLIVGAALLFAFKYFLLHKYSFNSAYFPFYAQLGYFVLGMLVYRVRYALTFNRKTTLYLGFAFTAVSISRTDLSFESMIIPAFPMLHVFMIALLCVAIPSLTQQFQSRRATMFGDMSYGVYILHITIIGLLHTLNMNIHRTLFTLLALSITALLSLTFEYGVQRHVDAFRRRLFYSPASK